MKFGNLASVEVAGLPAWVLVAGVLLVALAWWYYQERSARGVRRRAEGSGKRAAAGLSVGVGGILYAALGTARGLSGVLSQFGDVLLEIPDVAAYFATAGLGYGALKGTVPLSAQAFGVGAVVLFALGVALDD